MTTQQNAPAISDRGCILCFNGPEAASLLTHQQMRNVSRVSSLTLTSIAPFYGCAAGAVSLPQRS